jgi:hypothetical protein
VGRIGFGGVGTRHPTLISTGLLFYLPEVAEVRYGFYDERSKCEMRRRKERRGT